MKKLRLIGFAQSKHSQHAAQPPIIVQSRSYYKQWSCWRGVYDLCHVSRAILSCPCVFWLTQRAKTSYKIWCLRPLTGQCMCNSKGHITNTHKDLLACILKLWVCCPLIFFKVQGPLSQVWGPLFSGTKQLKGQALGWLLLQLNLMDMQSLAMWGWFASLIVNRFA